MRGLAEFARRSLGLALYPGQAEVLSAWERSGRRKAVLCLGRRSGKGLMAAVAAIYNAVVPDYSAHLRRGEARFIVIVACRQEQAREAIRTIRELLAGAPDQTLHGLVDVHASTQDEVAFRNGVVIRAMPCSSRSTRGLAISLLVLDEAAHMATTEAGFAAGKRVYQALVPSTAQFGEVGYVLVTSSPLWASGIFHELYQGGSSGAAPDVFVARQPTWEMNPTISRDSLDFEYRADPESANAEYGANFMEGAGAFLDAAAITACVVRGRRELPYLHGNRYVAAADPAFAAGGDAFTFAIGHRVGTGEDARYVLDLVRSWRGRSSPLNSDVVLDEVAELCRAYHIKGLTSDQYAVVPVSDGLRRRGITVRPGTLTAEVKADVFGALKRAINLERLELLDDPHLVGELVNLELRHSPSGKPRIAAGGGGHDDRAMVAAWVVHQLRPAASSTEDMRRLAALMEECASPSPLAGLLVGGGVYDILPAGRSGW